MAGAAELPHLNAALNGAAALLLAAGWRAIRAGRVAAHRRRMVAASVVSLAFLVSYVVYHLEAGSVRFTAPGRVVRTLYFTLLASHVVLAAANVPLVLLTLWRALRDDLERHRRIARIAFPVWMYVSVTGVAVYLMLYHLYRPAGAP